MNRVPMAGPDGPMGPPPGDGPPPDQWDHLQVNHLQDQTGPGGPPPGEGGPDPLFGEGGPAGGPPPGDMPPPGDPMGEHMGPPGWTGPGG